MVAGGLSSEGLSSALGGYRWRICALLFFATTINYVDRGVLSVLAPTLGHVIGWNERQYSYIVDAFQAAYAIGMLCAGVIIDRLGTRIGYALAICIWSLAAMSHALVRTVVGFALARFFLGLGESGNFPAAIKTVAEWFPRRERALATGIFNAGANVGAIVAPLVVPWVTLTWGWPVAFVFTGVLSATWLILWLTIYRPPAQHKRVSAQELAFIRSDPAEPGEKVPWVRLLGLRQTWAFAVSKLITDPIWWFFLFWLPKFLNSQYGLSLTELGPPLIVIYLMSDAGSIAGGWMAGRFLRRGWSLNRARKTAMLICALAVVPIVLVPGVHDPWVAVGLLGLATAGHQGWSANVFTLSSDLFPTRAVGSVVGLGGFAGAVGGVFVSTIVGFLLQTTGSYLAVFVMAGSAYLLALVVVQTLSPRLDRALLI